MKDCTQAVLFDLDNTISDAAHRRHLLPPLNPDSTWEEYSAASVADPPITGTLAAMRLYHPHYQVHIISGRSDSVLPETLEWLGKHEAQYDVLRLRALQDVKYTTGSSPNAVLKVNYIRQLRADGIDVVLFYEDWPEVGNAIERETGVPVLLVRNTEWP